MAYLKKNFILIKILLLFKKRQTMSLSDKSYLLCYLKQTKNVVKSSLQSFDRNFARQLTGVHTSRASKTNCYWHLSDIYALIGIFICLQEASGAGFLAELASSFLTIFSTIHNFCLLHHLQREQPDQGSYCLHP